MNDHPNDSQPRSAELLAKLRALGDEKSQGLDPYWKWGFCSGWNAALDAAPTRTQGADERLPPLPKPLWTVGGIGVFTEHQLQGYANAALALNRADDARPVAISLEQVAGVEKAVLENRAAEALRLLLKMRNATAAPDAYATHDTATRAQAPDSAVDALTGWKLVPHVPTREMIDAGHEQFHRVGTTTDCWQAMFCAAPSAHATTDKAAL